MTELAEAARTWSTRARILAGTVLDLWNYGAEHLLPSPRLGLACNTLDSIHMTTLLEAVALRAGLMQPTDRLVVLAASGTGTDVPPPLSY